MNLEDVKALKRLLEKPQRIAIIPHKNPDGDAIGSCLGLYHCLLSTGHQPRVIAPNDYPKFLKWLPGNDTILNFEKDQEASMEHINNASLIFTLDFNQLNRAGLLEKHLKEAKANFIMIDHHQAPGDYAEITYSDVTMSSTCEMVFNFMEAMGHTGHISSEIASCLYTGIMTDTGSFKYASTTGRTHEVVSQLIEKGANGTEIHHKIYDTFTPDRLRLLGCSLQNMVILPEFRTAYITLSQKELDLHNYKKGDTEGFVNYGLTLEDICFAVIFIENKDEKIIKISFRSIGEFSVNEFARTHFSGGGHTNAAGGRSEKNMAETISFFKELLADYKEKLVQ